MLLLSSTYQELRGDIRNLAGERTVQDYRDSSSLGRNKNHDNSVSSVESDCFKISWTVLLFGSRTSIKG